MSSSRLRIPCGRPSRLASALLIGTALALSACSAADTFGERTVTYNRQMQQARRELIVENILRAAYDQPLQFSEVSTVTGQASVGASLSGSLPFFGPRGAQMPRLFTLSPSVSASGGPSFTVGNLNTQEFLSGIIAPVKPEIIRDYLQIGYSRKTLLGLLVSSISFRRGPTDYIFTNNGTKIGDRAYFVRLLDALIAAGLSFETVTTHTPVGPVLTAADIRRDHVLATLLNTSQDAPLALSTVPTDKARHAAETYRLTRTEQASRYCMITESETLHDILNGQPHAPSAASVLTVTPFSLDGTPLTLDIGPADQCDTDTKTQSPAAEAALRADPNLITNLSFNSRSVRGVFAYLGTVARHELDAANPALFDRPGPDGATLRIFGIEPAAARSSPSPVDASFENRRYRTTAAFADDDTDRAIQLLSELMALYSAAKSFPAPSVLPILAP